MINKNLIGGKCMVVTGKYGIPTGFGIFIIIWYN